MMHKYQYMNNLLKFLNIQSIQSGQSKLVTVKDVGAYIKKKVEPK